MLTYAILIQAALAFWATTLGCKAEINNGAFENQHKRHQILNQQHHATDLEVIRIKINIFFLVLLNMVL